MKERYGIAEWYGAPFAHMSPDRRQALAKVALDRMQYLRPVRFNRAAFHAERKVASVRSSITAGSQHLTKTASGNGPEPR